ncbi:MAG: hypothetical protein A2Y92_02805 [Chloroflexi bacterium RBG_13_57_8]|nr:MAG: hypothetical protein A2Y92_02805 [Chloroflexi bacterium RBG_13_57_8]
MKGLFRIPTASPARVFTLRESVFAADLFIAAVSHLDFFNRLDKNPSDIDGICALFRIKKRPADVMLTLFKAYQLIAEKNRKYYLTDVSRTYLTARSHFDLSSYVSSLKDRPISNDMCQVLREGKPANWAAAKTGKEWVAAMEDDSFAASFTAGMNSRGAYLAGGLLQAMDLSGCRRLLDIGGASGIYPAVLMQKYPGMRAAVFDKPPVDKVAVYSLKKLGVANKIEVVAGDMFKDDLPGGYDVHLISHVLHDWDEKEVWTILMNSYKNLAPGGTVIIHDAHINRRKTGPLSIAEYSVLLMFLSEGKCYSLKEMEDALKKTGFKNIACRPTVYNRSIITGTK